MTVLLERVPGRSADREGLRRAVRDVCDAAGGTAASRRVEEAGGVHDLAVWDLLCERLDLAALGLPAGCGGRGGLPEVAAACEELGRALLPVPFLASTVLAGQVLARCGQRGAPALARVAAGTRATLAVVGHDGTWDPTRLQVAADQGGTSLTGVAEFVLDGTTAELVVVAARTPSGPDLFLVETGAAGVSAVAVEALDVSRTQADLALDGAAATRLTTYGTADQVLQVALKVAVVALAAEQLGGAQACLDLTVEHLRRRRPDAAAGSARSAARRCAELQVLVDSCRAAVERAVAVRPADARCAAAEVVENWCAAAYRTVTAESVRLCAGRLSGGDSDAHLYFRRARADAALLGAAHARPEQRWGRLTA